MDFGVPPRVGQNCRAGATHNGGVALTKPAATEMNNGCSSFHLGELGPSHAAAHFAKPPLVLAPPQDHSLQGAAVPLSAIITTMAGGAAEVVRGSSMGYGMIRSNSLVSLCVVNFSACLLMVCVLNAGSPSVIGLRRELDAIFVQLSRNSGELAGETE